MDSQAALELARQGKTMKEMAQALGMSYSAVQRWCKKNKVKPKKKCQRQRKLEYGQYDDSIADLRAQRMPLKEIAKELQVPLYYVRLLSETNGLSGNISQRVPVDAIKENLLRFGFDYIGGFAGTKSVVDVRCRKCGAAFGRRYDLWYARLRNGAGCCPGCAERSREEKRERDARTKEERLAKIADEKAKAQADLISRQTMERLANHVCKNCGKAFCIEATGYNSEKYCSEKCMKRWAMRVKNDRRIKRMNSREHDNDITLEKLYGRDKGICYLCGGLCDWTDIDPDGNAQDNYPSIDHVIPISKGGKHKWSNIKLAHRGCNWRKRDEIRPLG